MIECMIWFLKCAFNEGSVFFGTISDVNIV